MLVFENGVDVVRIGEGNRILVDFSIEVKELEASWSVKLPAYNILLFAKEEEKISESVHESLLSYFKYWIHVQGYEKFLHNMVKLGFSLKAETHKPSRRNAGGVKVVKGEKLQLNL